MAGFYVRTETFCRTLGDGLLRLMRPWTHGSALDSAGSLLAMSGPAAPAITVSMAASLLSQEILPLQRSAGPFGQLIEIGGRAVARAHPPGCPECERGIPDHWSPAEMIDTDAPPEHRWLYYLTALALTENAFLWDRGHRPLARLNGHRIDWSLQGLGPDTLMSAVHDVEWRVTDKEKMTGPGNRVLEIGRFLLGAREALGVTTAQDRKRFAALLESYDLDTQGYPAATGRMRRGLAARRLDRTKQILADVVDCATRHEPIEIDLIRMRDQLGLASDDRNTTTPGEGSRNPTGNGSDGSAWFQSLLGVFAGRECLERAEVDWVRGDSGLRMSQEYLRNARPEFIDTFLSTVRQGCAPRGDELDSPSAALVDGLHAHDRPHRGTVHSPSWRDWFSTPRHRRMILAFGTLGIASVAAGVITLSDARRDTTRVKGSATIAFVQTADRRVPLAEHTVVVGDTVVFKVPAGYQHALLIGVSTSGDWQEYYADHERSGPIDHRGGWLPNGVRFDEPVSERVFLILSQTPLESAMIRERIVPTDDGVFDQTQDWQWLEKTLGGRVDTWLFAPRSP